MFVTADLTVSELKKISRIDNLSTGGNKAELVFWDDDANPDGDWIRDYCQNNNPLLQEIREESQRIIQEKYVMANQIAELHEASDQMNARNRHRSHRGIETLPQNQQIRNSQDSLSGICSAAEKSYSNQIITTAVIEYPNQPLSEDEINNNQQSWPQFMINGMGSGI